MKEIYLGSTQIHKNAGLANIFVNPRIKGLESAEIRLPSFQRPNVDGAVVPNQLYGGRLITFEGVVWDSTVASYNAYRRTFLSAAKIQRSSAGDLLPITMKFTTMDDLMLQVDVYTKKIDFPHEWMSHGKFKLDFLAPDNYLVGQTLKSTEIYNFDAGGMGIPMGIPMNMGVGGAITTGLLNAGDIEAFPIIQFNGPVQNPQVVNSTSGKTMNLTYTLTAGQYIIVNTKLQTAVYYSSLGASPVNIRQYISGDFITLVPGTNSVKFINAVFSATGSVNFQWRDSYSGV